MSDKPLSVAISALIDNNKILLIKRIKGDYVGFWSLPGGKIEKNEHLSQAAVREIEEESGIKSEFKEHLGFVSEHLVENGQVAQHFLLHLCKLNPLSTEAYEQREGKLAWFDLEDLEQFEDQIIPSDYLMIQKMVKDKEKNYYDCVIEKNGEEHILKKFE